MPSKHIRLGVILVFIGLLAVFTFRYVQISRIAPFVPQPSSLTLDPPAHAITGTLSQSTGIVEHFTREADDYQEATPGGSIRQGESIATKRGSARINIENIGSVTLSNNSEMSFVNLIPSSLMLWHKSGSVEYEVNSVDPFSIRALHALITLSGDATINVSGEIVRVQVTKGSARLALVGTDNATQVWDITQGHLAQINDKTRQVVLR